MIEPGELLRVIDLLYAAALDGDWARPVGAMASLFGSGQAGLFQYDTRTRTLRGVVLVGIEPIYRETYAPIASQPEMDALWAAAVALSADGSPVIERYADDPGLSRTSFYHEWLRPQRIDRAIEVSALVPPCRLAMMAVARAAGAVEFDSDDIHAMRTLQPHLTRALQVRQRLEGADHEQRRMLDALDRIEHGVLLVDAHARVRHTNRTAEALLQRGDGLVARNDTLHCAQAADSSALRRLIGAAATGTIGAEGALAVRRSTGQPLSVLVAPLRPDDSRSDGPLAGAIVIVIDPGRSPADGAAELVRRYGLTPAEARTALALLDGGGLSGMAERLSVRLSTVRTLLQRVFAKTGTHRQAELVRLITTRQPRIEAEA